MFALASFCLRAFSAGEGFSNSQLQFEGGTDKTAPVDFLGRLAAHPSLLSAAHRNGVRNLKPTDTGDFDRESATLAAQRNAGRMGVDVRVCRDE
jgi:hypothetical protein